VNAANESLLGGGGIDGAIHSAAGPTLKLECKLLNGAETGETKLTLGHKLPSKYIFHTVGPRVIGRKNKLPKKQLANCYQTTLDLMIAERIRSVAYCAISTGIFGYPLHPATHTAMRTVRKWLEKKENRHMVDRIIFVVWSDEDRRAYEQIMQIYFPTFDWKSYNTEMANPPRPTPLLFTTKLKKWTKIEKLLNEISGPEISIDAFLNTMQNIPGNKSLDLSGLKLFFEKFADEDELKIYKNEVLPFIVKLALSLPTIFRTEQESVVPPSLTVEPAENENLGDTEGEDKKKIKIRPSLDESGGEEKKKKLKISLDESGGEDKKKILKISLDESGGEEKKKKIKIGQEESGGDEKKKKIKIGLGLGDLYFEGLLSVSFLRSNTHL